ncbi:MAG: transposase family protein [Nitrospirae bacterium]|nr:transposase family protein [Nitrospirota bacterium]
MGRGRETTEAAHCGNVQGSKGSFDQYEEEQKEQETLIGALVSTVTHLFGPLNSLFHGVTDPRNPRKTTYSLAGLVFCGILMFLCHLKARRQIGLLFRNGPSASKFHSIFGVKTFPHGDTINDVFRKLDPQEVQEVISGMTESLIRKKVLYQYRLLETYFVIAVDGTGVLTFGKRHCNQCLTRTHNGKTLYYHNVLEAKLVTPNGFVFSLMTEFIENPGVNPTKQDCELKAFYRLAARLKERFPRLPILLTMDGLFAGGPTFDLCRNYDWKFMIVLKDNDLPSINGEFEALAKLQPENRILWNTGNKAEVKQEFRWVDDILYIDCNSKEHILSVVACHETKPGKFKRTDTTNIKWTTNYKITTKNVIALANDGGRIRWKLENEGFNVQKNGGYALEHAYTKDSTSAKVFYYVLQIAHMLAQLIEKSSLLKKAFPKGLGSIKNLAFRLLEAWRNARLSKNDIDAILLAHFQIRFSLDSS